MAVDLVGATDTKPVTVVVKPPPYYTLKVQKTGNGKGTVYSDDYKISCGATCIHDYKIGTQVTLYAYPKDEASFVGWSGACSGTGECTITMDDDKIAVANFSMCAEVGESCDSTPCCGQGTCVPNNGCPGSDPFAANVCYGPCGTNYPIDCGTYCCSAYYPVCGGDCWCWEW
jgi:hypothetical protein